jgi:hypothetical protein
MFQTERPAFNAEEASVDDDLERFLYDYTPKKLFVRLDHVDIGRKENNWGES